MFTERSSSFAVVIAAMFAVGCGGAGDDPRGQRVPVKGTVTLDGAPLSAGRIILETNQGEGEVKAVAMIENGEFEFTEMNGPLPGAATVRVFAREPELEELEAARRGDSEASKKLAVTPIPPRYNSQSQIQAEISGDGEMPPLSFALTTK